MCGYAHAPVASQQYLEEIFVSGFRNLTVQEISFSPRINLLLGKNGQGKTNLLEAIFFLSLFKPLRAASSSELLSWGKELAMVRGRFKKDGISSCLEARLEGSRKRVSLDGKARTSLDAAGCFQTVIFSPDDLDLIKGSPEVRRRFLDRAAFILMRNHLKNLLLFRRALRSRNNLLKNGKWEELEVFGRQFAHYGALITTARKKVTEELAQIIAVKSAGEIAVKFRPGWPLEENKAEEKLLAALNGSLATDRHFGHTRYGPQRDELEIFFRSRPAAAFASQGQKRNCAIGIMLALVELLKRKGASPVLLLDDISSELDEENRRAVINQAICAGGQVFITATEFDCGREFSAERSVFEIEAGVVKRRG